MLGKKSSEKVRKTFFYIHTKIVTKKWGGGKRAKQVFQKYTNSARKKCLEKNRRKKGRKTFFYIHTNIVTKKLGEKTREIIFPERHELCEQKMFGKNRRKKGRIKIFIFTRIS